VRVEGDQTHPITRGFLCVKVNQYIEHVYGERRVLTPRRRVGPKASGKFAENSWD
jgi:anaerobic selenocysteine-containing dehydrogenase